MRRLLLMLPVLALVACQADTPTEVDAIHANNQPADAGLQVILQDQIVYGPLQPLEFVVVNPFPDSWWNPEDIVQEIMCEGIGNLTVVAQGEPGEVTQVEPLCGSAFCSGTTHWGSLTSGDDVPDLAVHFFGYDICNLIPLSGGSTVDVEIALYGTGPDGLPFNISPSERFRIRCAYLQ